MVKCIEDAHAVGLKVLVKPHIWSHQFWNNGKWHGDIKFKTETDKTRHPVAESPKDKATIYVVRPTKFGAKVQTKLAVDGKWMGVNRANNYFFFALDPGEHYFCSKAENRSVMKLKVEAGKTYYLQQKVKMGFMKARNQLVQIDEEQGKVALGKTHPSTWEEKK